MVENFLQYARMLCPCYAEKQVVLVAHTLLSFLMYRYYERKYGAANARRVENQYVDKEQRDQYN